MKRLPLPDIMKGFAVFLIIPVHILETFIQLPGRESMFGKILLFMGGPFAVPVFMIIMGYFMAKNQKSLSVNLYRGLTILWGGFLLNIGLNFHLLLKIKFAGWQINPLEYIFGVDIFYFAGLAIIILSLLKTLKSQGGWIAPGLAFVVAYLTSFINELLIQQGRNYIFPFIGGNWSWSYFPLFPWLTYPLAGFAFFYVESSFMAFIKSQKVVALVLLVAVAAGVAVYAGKGYETTIQLSDYYHHTFGYSMWTLGVVILWSLLLWPVSQRFSKTYTGQGLIWLGRNITVFYIVQWLIIGNIATAIYQSQPLSSYVFWFAGIFAATVILTWLVEKNTMRFKFLEKRDL